MTWRGDAVYNTLPSTTRELIHIVLSMEIYFKDWIFCLVSSVLSEIGMARSTPITY